MQANLQKMMTFFCLNKGQHQGLFYFVQRQIITDNNSPCIGEMASIQNNKQQKKEEVIGRVKPKKMSQSLRKAKQSFGPININQISPAFKKDEWAKGNMNTVDSLQRETNVKNLKDPFLKKKKAVGSTHVAKKAPPQLQKATKNVQQWQHNNRQQPNKNLLRNKRLSQDFFSKSKSISSTSKHIRHRSLTNPHKAVLQYAGSFKKLLCSQNFDDISIISLSFSESVLTKNKLQSDDKISSKGSQQRQQIRKFQENFKANLKGIVLKSQKKEEKLILDEKTGQIEITTKTKAQMVDFWSKVKMKRPPKVNMTPRQSIVVTPNQLNKIIEFNSPSVEIHNTIESVKQQMKRYEPYKLFEFHPNQLSKWNTLNRLINQHFLKSQTVSPRCIINQIDRHNYQSNSRNIIVDELSPGSTSIIINSPFLNQFSEKPILFSQSNPLPIGIMESQHNLSQEQQQWVDDDIDLILKPVKVQMKKNCLSDLNFTEKQELVDCVLQNIVVQFAENLKKLTRKSRAQKKKAAILYDQSIDICQDTIRQYLGLLIQQLNINRKFLAVALQQINKPAGLNSTKMLQYMRLGEVQTVDDYAEELVIPIDCFYECEKKIISQIALSKNGKTNLIVQFWHRALYEALNEHLDKYRPYGLERQPFRWENHQFYHKLQISQTQLFVLFQEVIEEICLISIEGAGLIPEKQQYRRFDRFSLAELSQDRMCRLLTEECYQNEKQYLNYSDQRTYLIMEITYLLEHWVIREVTQQISSLIHRTAPPPSYNLISL